MHTFVIRSAVVSGVAVAIVAGALNGSAWAGSTSLTGTLSLNAPSGVSQLSRYEPTYGDTVSFTAQVSGRIPKNSKTEIAVFCADGTGTPVLQGVVAPSTSFALAGTTAMPWGGQAADCAAALRVVDLIKYSVTVLDSISFHVTASA